LKITFENKFMKDLQKRMQKVSIEVGILSDRPRKLPDHKNFKSFNGAVANRLKSKIDTEWMRAVSKDLQAAYDYLKKPFKLRSNKDVLRLSNDFCKYFFGKSTERRLINLSQAIIRNPILGKKYGHNSGSWQMIKGFDHVMIDSGQFFNAITARFRKQ